MRLLMRALCLGAVSALMQTSSYSGPSTQCPDRKLEWGSYGTGPGQFHDPQDITVDENGSIYVLDTGNSRVEKFNAMGDLITSWGSNGNGNSQFNNALFICADKHGHIVVCDSGNSRILKFSLTGQFLLGFGSPGSGPQQFSTPSGVTTDASGNIYVVDGNNNRIQEFSSNGNFLRAWGSPGSGPGQFDNARGIAVGSDGNVFVGDFSNHRIQKFTSSGVYLSSWSTGVSSPYNLEASPQGYIYAPDANNAIVHVFDNNGGDICSFSGGFHLATGVGVNAQGELFSIEWFDAPNFKEVIEKYSNTPIPPPPFLLKWGSQGNGWGQFQEPRSIACDLTGHVFVADYANHRIQKFSSSGGFLKSWGGNGGGPGEFLYPAGVTCDPSGRVYVVDQSNYRVQVFTNDGDYEREWSLGSGNGAFIVPTQIALDPQGNVFVLELIPCQVRKFDNAGNLLTSWGSRGSADGQMYFPEGLAVDQSGSVYVADSNNQRVVQFTNAGQFVRAWPTDSGPFDVAIKPNGNVLVANHEGHSVQEFSRDGQLIVRWGTPGVDPGEFGLPWALDVDALGNIYVSDTGDSRIQEFGPGPGLRPVVMVHGYCSDGTAWTNLGNYLTAQGFSPHAINLIPNNEHPQVLTAQLADYLDTNFPNQDVDIIAHSMGGLVTRQLIRQRKEDCHIKTLITLGTPHHGVDLLRFLSGVDAFWRQYLTITLGLDCQIGGNGVVDLIPGSNFLNRLNYDTYDQIDHSGRSSHGRRPSEDDYDAGVDTWTIAGTKGFDDGAHLATLPAWDKNYQNDGVVGVDAAVLWNNLDQARLDTDMGLDPIQHTSLPLAYFGRRNFQSAQDLFPILENVLRGGTAPGSVSAHQRQSVSQPTTEPDSTITLLNTSSASLPAGQTIEWPVRIPSVGSAQFMSLADSVVVGLREPNGTLLTPADTLTHPELHFTADPATGLAIYKVDNPTQGQWSVVFNASGRVTKGQYAASVYGFGTTVVSVEATPSHVYGPTTHIVTSLDKAGVHTPATSWTISILRPNASSFTMPVFDDGLHGDGSSGDGLYGADMTLGGPVGPYQLTATATDPSNSATFIGSTTIESAEFKDLAIDSTLSFSQNQFMVGDSLMVSSTVRNLGTTAVSNIVVELWDNHTKLNTHTLSLNGGQSNGVSFLWHVAAPDTHLVELVVNPFVVTDEANNDNDTAAKRVVLGVPVGVPIRGGKGGQLQVAPPMPNPSNGHVQFRFTTPRLGPASFEIYDIMGRRIKHWDWPALVSGDHTITWNGQDDHGSSIAPGILFYRLRSNGQTLRQKMIHLQ